MCQLVASLVERCVSRLMSHLSGFPASKHSLRLSDRRICRLERLETREVLTTTLFLDFGAGIGFDSITGEPNELVDTIQGFRDIFGSGIDGRGTGSDLTLYSDVGVDNSLTFRPMCYDFDLSGSIDSVDLIALATAVVPLIEEIVEPFDLNIELAACTSLGDASATVAANSGNLNGEYDAYNLVVEASYAPSSMGPGSFLGLAASDDYFGGGNRQDEATLTLIDRIILRLESSGLTKNTVEFNNELVVWVARVLAHEAFHTFGYPHEVFGGAYAGPDELQLANGILMQGTMDPSAGDSFYEQPLIVRFPLVDATALLPPVEYVTVDHYEIAASNGDIGLRDLNGNAVPDIAYVTGTGANDHIQLVVDPNDNSLVNVVVTPYIDEEKTAQSQRYTELLDPTSSEPIDYSYSIDLTSDTDGEILIDLGHGYDLVEIDAAIAADFRVRGSLGDDEVRVIGAAESRIRSFSFEGQLGDDVLTVDFQSGDALPLAGYNFQFIGGEGADDTVVVDPSGTNRKGFFVDTLTDGADVNLADGRADANGADDDQVTLRAAVQEANQLAAPTWIFLPEGHYVLETDGIESSDGAVNDLDITSSITIVGVGAGLSVIDASGFLAAGTDTRVFDVQGSGTLKLERSTVTGGDATAEGGGVRVRNGATATLDNAAVVANQATAGGGIYVDPTGSATVTYSVVTGNNATSGETGGIFAADGAGLVTITGTVIALNTDGQPAASDDIFAAGARVFTTGGSNLIGTGAPASGDGFVFGSAADLQAVSDPDYVVTTIDDEADATNGLYALSLRDAVIAANANTDTPEEIWLPAWELLLTIPKDFAGTEPYLSAADGDLVITDSLTIRGVAGHTAVGIMASGLDDPLELYDSIFELLGDYDADGDVDIADLMAWQRDYQNAYYSGTDGNEDGVVDAIDRAIWSEQFGDIRSLIDIQQFWVA